MNNPSPTRPEIPPPFGKKWPWTVSKQSLPKSHSGLEYQPLVSVIIPSLNQGQFIEETLRSILLQDYPRVEIIVVDGGSTDDTLNILRHYNSNISWVSRKDEGQADAINKGIAIANGQILSYLNSDDYLLEGCINRVVEAFHGNPGVGMVFGDCYAVNTCSKFASIIQGRPYDQRAMIEKGAFIPQQGAFWSRDLFAKTGDFRKNLHFAMDHDFFIRAGNHCNPQYIGEPLAVFRFHDGNKSVRSEHLHWKEVIKVCRTHGLRIYNRWLWIRILRHYLLRAMPARLQLGVRRRLKRSQDPILMSNS